MCCGLAILALLGPRALAIFWWIFDTSSWNRAFDSVIWPILGIVFLPWTTIMYLLVYQGGITGFDWVWMGLAVAVDIASYGGSAYGNKDKLQMA
jgi:hypothetical protein